MTARTQAFEQSVFGFKSERNTSVTNLTSSSTFTGLIETFASNEVFVTVQTDQSGTLFLDFSDDQGVTFETKEFAVTAGEYKEVHEFKAARTFRVRFTNTSASSQTSFSLNTYYGQFDSIDSASSGGRTPGSDNPTEIALGNVEGYETVQIRGFNPDLGASFEDIWDAGGVMTYPTAGEQWEVVSDDANDTSAGTGARTVLITYLDDTYTMQTEVVTLNGTTPVTTTATDIFRSISTAVISWGAVDSTNLGNITIRVASGGATRCMVLFDTAVVGDEYGLNLSHNGRYTVPAGKTLIITDVTTNTPKNSDATIIIQNRPFGFDGFLVGSTISSYQAVHQSSVNNAPNANNEKTDIRFRARSTNTNVPVSVFVSGILIDN